MISASDPDRRDALQRQAAQVSASYLQYVVNDPLVAHMDKHPIEKLEVAKTLTPPLQAIATRLKHLAA